MKKAFTLAEVLSALAIVGVIVAVTVPTLQAGFLDRKYKSLAKKAHLTLQQAIDATMLEDEIRKARADMGLVYWLAADTVGGHTKEEPSLRTIETELDHPTNLLATVRTTDGMIIQDANDCYSCATDELCDIYVDVDGRSGPTGSTMASELATLADTASAADIMFFQCRNNTVMPPLRTEASAAAHRTRIHLGIEEN